MDGEQCFLIPFYEYMKTIIGVTALPLKIGNCNDKHIDFKGNFITEFTLNFDNNTLLTESRKHNSNRFDVRLIMRFCKNEDKVSEKKQISMVDCFPQNLKIDINNQPVKLSSYLPYDRFRKPGRMNPRLLDITNLILEHHICTHTCNINWVQDDGEEHFNFALYLVRRRSFEELSRVLKDYRIFSVQNTINLLSERTIIHPVNNKSNIEYMFQDRKVLNASLVCPISLSRMKIPVRGGNCTHLKCFDLMSFLIINFQKPTWTCPVCDKKTFFCHLKIDGLIFSIIDDERSNLMDEIKFNEHGQWKSYDEDSSENSNTDSFYDIPENYFSLEINNEQCNGGSNIQRSSEIISRMDLNKDAKNILPMSDWMSLKNEYCCSINTNMVASLANNTISNVNSKSLSTQNIANKKSTISNSSCSNDTNIVTSLANNTISNVNSKSLSTQNIANKKSTISNSSQSNIITNSKTLVFQETSHQTNLNSNSNNYSNNNLKRTHVHSSSESLNEKELPVKKPTLDSRCISKVNGSKTVTASVHNDQPINTDSEYHQNQFTMQDQSLSNSLNNNKINKVPTSFHFNILKSRSLLYRNIRNFIFTKKEDPSIEIFNGVTSVPNILKFNTYDKDFIVMKFKEIISFSLKEIIGSIKQYENPLISHKQGERVIREVNIHVAKATITLSFNQETVNVLPNNSLSIEIDHKFCVDEMKLEIQNTPACIAIELIYIENIIFPFPPLKSLVGEICLDNEILEQNISFLKYKYLTIQDEDELTVFVDIRVGDDNFHTCHLLAITIMNIKGAILIDEIVCPRNRITHFRKEVTGITADQIINRKDAYLVITQVRNILHGKIIIGYNIGNKLASLFMDFRHIIGLRDLSEDKWAKKYARNAQRPKLLNIIETLFKSSRKTADEKDFLVKARKESIPTTLDKVILIGTTYSKIRSTGEWEDTITPNAKLTTTMNFKDTESTKPVPVPIINKINEIQNHVIQKNIDTSQNSFTHIVAL